MTLRPTREWLAKLRAADGHLGTLGVRDLFAEIDALTAERDEARALTHDVFALVDESSRMYHDSTLWEGDADLGPKWQALYDRQPAVAS